MYLQEVVISPDIFEKISKAFSQEFEIDLDLRSYKNNLALKKVLFDKNEVNESEIEKRINEIKNSSSDFGKQKIDSILKLFLISGRNEFKKINNCKNFCEDTIQNKVLNLSLLSKSKLINSEDKNLYPLKLKYEDDLKEIEVLDFEEFINPKSNSKVFCLNKAIEIQRGEEFVIEEYFLPYIVDASEIKITDRFIRKRQGGYLNLVRLLGLCKNLKRLTINTIKKDESEKYKPDIKLDIFEQELKEKFQNIELSINSTGDHWRILETKKFKITLEPGFDFVNEIYIAEKQNVLINFNVK